MSTTDDARNVETMWWRQRRWRVAMAMASVALVVTGAFGGFGKADAGDLAAVKPGQSVDNGALAITPLRAWRSGTQPGRMPDPADRTTYLVLQVRVDNRTDTGFSAFSYMQSDVAWLSADAAERLPDSLLRGDDHGPYVAFPPRLPVTVDLVWKLPAGSPPPPSMGRWRVYQRTFVEQTYLARDTAWLQGRALAQLQLPVVDRRDEAATP